MRRIRAGDGNDIVVVVGRRSSWRRVVEPRSDRSDPPLRASCAVVIRDTLLRCGVIRKSWMECGIGMAVVRAIKGLSGG